MKKFIFFLLPLLPLGLWAQLTETFSDTNFTQNPHWSGMSSSWIINNQLQLQSNDTVANSIFYLSTPNRNGINSSWKFTAQLNFNPSGLNYVDVYLVSADSNLLRSNNLGYFVRIGNTNDEVALYRKDSNSIIKIIDGVNGALNNSTNLLKIKVERNENFEWRLFYSNNNDPDLLAGTIIDSTYLQSSYFGFIIKQSTASFFKKHLFDDIEIATIVRDTIPPVLDTISLVDSSHLDLYFNEFVTPPSIFNNQYYQVDHGVGTPSMIILDSINPQLVHLVFSNSFPVRNSLTLSVNGISDLSNNVMLPQTKSFVFYVPMMYDIVIDEIMPDPSPSNGYPEEEWIEIKNISPFDVNLKNWKIGKQNSLSGAMPSYILKSDSMLVITATGSVGQMINFAPCVSVTNFPTLNNTGDLIYLLSPKGATVHSVAYSDSWYQNELKKQGGWSLEMMDVNAPCIGQDNWLASKALLGATPGKINSRDAVNINITTPQLLNAFAVDSLHIVLSFNETIDSIEATHLTNFLISNDVGNPIQSTPLAPVFNKVLLTLSHPLLKNNIYFLELKNIKDCIGGVVDSTLQFTIALSQPLDSFDLVINEILFNPPTNGVDFVEIYNRSNKPINLKDVYIANCNSLGQIDNIEHPIQSDLMIFPGDYYVLTNSVSVTLNNYFSYYPNHILQADNLPSFYDDAGTVVLLNGSGQVIDRVSYSADWHFSLLDKVEGVSLERVDPDGISQSGNNWHSASSSAGYGTPAYQNSQYKNHNNMEGIITISPSIISPNNDGIDDIAFIDYQFSESGIFANVTLFDVNGKKIRLLEKNALCGSRGYFIWNGLAENNQKVASGVYIIYVEAIDIKGAIKKYKKAIVVSN